MKNKEEYLAVKTISAWKNYPAVRHMFGNVNNLYIAILKLHNINPDRSIVTATINSTMIH